MGPINSKSTELKFQEINHPQFRNVEVIEADKNTEKLIKIRVPINGEKVIRDWESGLKSVKNFDKQSLLLPTYHSFENQGFCGTSGILNIFFNYYPYILFEEIDNRKAQQQKKFDQNQLWYVLYTICSAANQFHTQKKQKLGDIRPENIFINDDGHIKLANIYSWPNAQSNYENSLLNNQITFLAPEELEQLHYGKDYPKTDSLKSESFSIGLTLLDCIFLSDSKSLYNLQNYRFANQKLQNSLSRLDKEPFSDYFKKFILKLLEIDPAKRMSAGEVCKELEPYSSKIKNLQDFIKPNIQVKGNYDTPEASSNVYSSYVTKGFTQKNVPSYYDPKYVGSSGQKQDKASIKYSEFDQNRFTRANQKSSVQPTQPYQYQPPVIHTTNTVYQPTATNINSYNNYSNNNQRPNETQSRFGQINTYHNSESPSNLNYKNRYSINSEYEPNQADLMNTSVGTAPKIAQFKNNYANTYGSSYIPNPVYDSKNFNISTNNGTQPQNSSAYSYSNLKPTYSTYVKPNETSEIQIPPILPTGTETITYEITPSQQQKLRYQKTYNNRPADTFVQTVKSKYNNLTMQGQTNSDSKNRGQ